MNNTTSAPTETDRRLRYWVTSVLQSRTYGATYMKVGFRQPFDHGDIRFSCAGYGRSLQSGGNKYKAYAHRDGRPVPSRELEKLLKVQPYKGGQAT